MRKYIDKALEDAQIAPPRPPGDRSDAGFLHPLMNEQEAAGLLSLSVKTLQGWRVRGFGPVFVKLSPRAVRYRLGDLELWVEARICANTSQVLA